MSKKSPMRAFAIGRHCGRRIALIGSAAAHSLQRWPRTAECHPSGCRSISGRWCTVTISPPGRSAAGLVSGTHLRGATAEARREAQEGQRPIAIHALENLAHSDTGIVMLRRLLREQLKRVEQGLDPINVMRDASANKRIPTGAWNTILSPREAAALPYTEDL